MDKNKAERKVTVILAADVVDYSTKMEEKKNLKRWGDWNFDV